MIPYISLMMKRQPGIESLWEKVILFRMSWYLYDLTLSLHFMFGVLDLIHSRMSNFAQDPGKQGFMPESSNLDGILEFVVLLNITLSLAQTSLSVL